jgi:hypothetical protein
MEVMNMKNYKDIETILNLTGSYEWNDKILIRKTNNGFEVNGFEFRTVKAACDFIEKYVNVSIFSRSVEAGSQFAKASARRGVKLAATGLWRIGKTMEMMGAAIKKGANKW